MNDSPLLPVGAELPASRLHTIDGHSHAGPPYLDWLSQFYPNETDLDIVSFASNPMGAGPNLLQFILCGSPLSYDATIVPVLECWVQLRSSPIFLLEGQKYIGLLKLK